MPASLWKALPEINVEDELGLAVRNRFRGDENAAIGDDDPARRLVVLVAGDLDATQADLARHPQHQRKSASRIAAALLPRHHSVADMTGDIVGQRVAAWCEAQIITPQNSPSSSQKTRDGSRGTSRPEA